MADVDEITPEEISRAWQTLFDAHPWLDGLTNDTSCGNVLCCPPAHLPDYGAFQQAVSLLFLHGGPTTVSALRRDLVPPIDLSDALT